MTTTASAVVVATMAATGIALAQPALGQSADQRLGKVNFETSCKPEAQKHFNRAMLYQHSFWYRASQKAFEDVAEGRSRVRHCLLGHRAKPALEPARAAAGEESRRGRRRDRKGKERRRQDPARARLPRRARRHVCRLRQGRPPHAHRGLCEGDGAVGAALSEGRRGADPLRALRSTRRLRRPTRPTPTSSRARRILEPIAKRQPQHPGVAHYLIHLYDSPPIAEKGLDAARRYAKIAPGAPHAQHMPSHIFTRVGYWKESIASNAEVGACREGGQRRAMTSCTPWTTWSMPICSSGRTRRPRPSSTR